MDSISLHLPSYIATGQTLVPFFTLLAVGKQHCRSDSLCNYLVALVGLVGLLGNYLMAYAYLCVLQHVGLYMEAYNHCGESTRWLTLMNADKRQFNAVFIPF